MGERLECRRHLVDLFDVDAVVRLRSPPIVFLSDDAHVGGLSWYVSGLPEASRREESVKSDDDILSTAMGTGRMPGRLAEGVPLKGRTRASIPSFPERLPTWWCSLPARPSCPLTRAPALATTYEQALPPIPRQGARLPRPPPSPHTRPSPAKFPRGLSYHS